MQNQSLAPTKIICYFSCCQLFIILCSHLCSWYWIVCPTKAASFVLVWIWCLQPFKGVVEKTDFCRPSLVSSVIYFSFVGFQIHASTLFHAQEPTAKFFIYTSFPKPYISVFRISSSPSSYFWLPDAIWNKVFCEIGASWI